MSATGGLADAAVGARFLAKLPAFLRSPMALVTFRVMHVTPGSPLDPMAEGANPLPPDAQPNLARAYGFDRPRHQQFLIFVGKAARGDFGQSFASPTTRDEQGPYERAETLVRRQIARTGLVIESKWPVIR